MLKASIAIPKFAAQHVARLLCRYCDRPLLPSNVLAAGIRHPTGFASSFVFAMTIHCDYCKKRTPTCVPSRPLDGRHWAAQVAAATPAQPVPQGDRNRKPVETPVADQGPWTDEPPEERPEFHAVPVVVLNYTPGNYDHADGEPASILTVARNNGAVEPLVFSTEDTKKLITRALVTLATYDDPLAQKMLDKYFEADDDGDFHWPGEPPPDWA